MITSQNVKSRTACWTDNNPDKPELDGESVQLNVDQQSCGKQSIIGYSDNVTKNYDEEITKNTREILEQTESIMKESSKESKQESITSRNDTPRWVDRQQMSSARGDTTITRN